MAEPKIYTPPAQSYNAHNKPDTMEERKRATWTRFLADTATWQQKCSREGRVFDEQCAKIEGREQYENIDKELNLMSSQTKSQAPVDIDIKVDYDKYTDKMELIGTTPIVEDRFITGPYGAEKVKVDVGKYELWRCERGHSNQIEKRKERKLQDDVGKPTGKR